MDELYLELNLHPSEVELFRTTVSAVIGNQDAEFVQETQDLETGNYSVGIVVRGPSAVDHIFNLGQSWVYCRSPHKNDDFRKAVAQTLTSN